MAAVGEAEVAVDEPVRRELRSESPRWVRLSLGHELVKRSKRRLGGAEDLPEDQPVDCECRGRFLPSKIPHSLEPLDDVAVQLDVGIPIRLSTDLDDGASLGPAAE